MRQIFFLKGCGDKNICKKSVTGLFLNIILLLLVFLVMILLCSVLNQEELLYLPESLSKID